MFPIVLYVNKSLFRVFFVYLSTFPALFYFKRLLIYESHIFELRIKM